jgi:hypothetical protein
MDDDKIPDHRMRSQSCEGSRQNSLALERLILLGNIATGPQATACRDDKRGDAGSLGDRGVFGHGVLIGRKRGWHNVAEFPAPSAQNLGNACATPVFRRETFATTGETPYIEG